MVPRPPRLAAAGDARVGPAHEAPPAGRGDDAPARPRRRHQRPGLRPAALCAAPAAARGAGAGRGPDAGEHAGGEARVAGDERPAAGGLGPGARPDRAGRPRRHRSRPPLPHAGRRAGEGRRRRESLRAESRWRRALQRPPIRGGGHRRAAGVALARGGDAPRWRVGARGTAPGGGRRARAAGRAARGGRRRPAPKPLPPPARRSGAVPRRPSPTPSVPTSPRSARTCSPGSPR